MADGKLKSARAVAIEVLNRCDPKSNYAGSILDRVLHETSQRQRATDLVFGTLRNRGAIDAVISAFSGRPVERIQGRLLNIIRIGAYELLYSPATEAYAIVSEAVESTKTIAGQKQTGFVNAVLRQISRRVSNRQAPLTRANAERTVPQTPSTGCEFDAGFLPTSAAEYLSTAFSLPEWLVTDWLDEFGEESTRRICFASNRRPSIYIRPNGLRTTAAALVEKLRQAGIVSETNADDSMIRIASPRELVQLPGFAEGEFTVQDITASGAVKLLDPQPGWTILDLCAAPGTKTTQLAEATGDSATIVATDIDSRRLEMVKENIARLGIKSVRIVPYENLQSIATEVGLFDAVLLDVPCSNTGVLAKRVEARYRVSPESIRALTKIQAELFGTAALMLKSGGKICYSTCSIQRCENTELVRGFLKASLAFELESEELTLPCAEGLDHDGGYVAILIRHDTGS
ncbi:MAG TPA: transcription antitermination factor NusB [Sedimentisphaerales bacterium]|nr:transcription antitermination factor NusB [Sedimentisphaerales bacterium]